MVGKAFRWVGNTLRRNWKNRVHFLLSTIKRRPREKIPPKKPIPFREGKIPLFKRHVNPTHYSFEEHEKWFYKDAIPNVRNFLVPHGENIPTLVLKDAQGTPRFVLPAVISPGFITILSIQRLRTQYKKSVFSMVWSARRETKASKQFQGKLGGMHPAEFLLSEFLFRHRKEIREGTKVFLEVPLWEKKLYLPLVERFFMPSGGPKNQLMFLLNPRKRRVIEVVGAEQ